MGCKCVPAQCTRELCIVPLTLFYTVVTHYTMLHYFTRWYTILQSVCLFQVHSRVVFIPLTLFYSLVTLLHYVTLFYTMIRYLTLSYTILHYLTLFHTIVNCPFLIVGRKLMLDNVEAHWLQHCIKKGENDEKASHFLFSKKKSSLLRKLLGTTHILE